MPVNLDIPAGFNYVVDYVPWTPADAGAIAWYDASDASTITEVSGAVSQLSDKSGNDRHMVQATGASQPITGTTTINGVNALDFDGSDDFLSAANAAWHNNGNLNIFTVAQHRSPGSTDMIIANNVGGVSGFFCRIQGTTGYRTSFEGDGVNANANGLTAYMPHVFGSRFADPYVGSRFDGGTEVTNDGSGYTSTPSQLTIGAGVNGTANLFNGAIAEIVIISGVLSTADRQKIEGYLAHKWGLNDKLDAGHPYKNNPAMFGF